MKRNPIDAVVFDLDGVITDTAYFHFIAWKQLAEELGIFIDEQFNERLKGISRMDSLELILREGKRESDFTIVEKEALADRKNQVYTEFLKGLSKENILPGITNLIEKIKAERLPIGLASVSKNAKTVLKGLGLEDAFDYIADASKIRNSKPDPEIFLTVCAAFGANPAHTIGIEDAQAGIEAINASGMFSVGVGLSLERADLRVNSTEQLCWTKIKDRYQCDRV